jgi:NAD(P)H-hydrate repair Nnr-like enzyme with NAD(P)H-hydrate dehydratase domain
MISTKLTTADDSTIHPFIKKLHIPAEHSHKGQNGRVLIIGGSKLFHAASLWAAEIATYMVDMVHYASTLENEQVFLALKTKFHDGIVVSQKDIPSYVSEDDANPYRPRYGAGKHRTSIIRNENL